VCSNSPMDHVGRQLGPNAGLTCPFTAREAQGEQAISRLLKDQSRGDAQVRDRMHVMTEFEWIRTLLRQASDHQTTLLMPSHPSPARIAGLRSWIRDCVKEVSETQRFGAEITHSDQIASVEEIASLLAAVGDAFHLYASMLERFRSAEAGTGLSPQPRPLVAVAEDERLLVSCRVALRGSLQQLISVLQTDNLRLLTIHDASWINLGRQTLDYVLRLLYGTGPTPCSPANLSDAPGPDRTTGGPGPSSSLQASH
jgi:hypothetical protein